MVQPILFSYGALSAVATIAYLAWGWARARTIVDEHGAEARGWARAAGAAE